MKIKTIIFKIKQINQLIFLVRIFVFLLNFLQCSEIHSFSRTCLRLSVCLCSSLSMCVKMWACTYMSSCMCANLGDLPEQLRLSLFVDFVDFVSKIQLPNTFRRCVVLCQDAHSAQSQQQLEACVCGWKYVWMNTYACMYIWIRIYEDARILVSFAAQAPRTKHQLESMKLLCCTLHSVFQNEIKVGYLKPH